MVGFLAFLAIGSFTCVVIDRLPLRLEEANEFGDRYDTNKWRYVFGGTSRCSSCGASVRVRDNIPVLGWLLLRGKCRDCGERIPAYHPVVELTTPLLFLLTMIVMGWDDLRVVVLLFMIPVGIAITVIDFRHYIVPTRLVWPSLGIVAMISVVIAAIEGQWGWLISAIIGLAAFAGPLFVIWFLVPRGMGFGDVRLSTLLGYTVGFFAGINQLAPVLLVLGALIIASVLGILLGVVALGARGRKAKVPFGPSLIVGAYVVVLLAEEILGAYDLYSLV